MSTTPARATSAFSTVKRSACDRCRGQKLRCPQRDDPSMACTRCIRLGAQCVTSYSKPPGRAAKSHAVEAASTSTQSRPELRPKPTPPPTATPSSTPGNTSSGPEFSAAVTHQNGGCAQPETADTLFFSPTQTLVSLHQDEFMFLDDAPPEDMSDLVSNDFDTRFYMPALSDYGAGGGSDGTSTSSMNCSDSTRESRPASISFAKETPNTILECDARLSRLSLDLSKRHEQCLAMLDSMRQGGPQSYSEGGDDHRNFEHAVRDLSEFLAIVRMYSPKKDGHSSGGIDSRGLSSQPRRRIGLVIVLDILSAYLQIVAIYEKLFRCLKAQITQRFADGEQHHAPLGLSLNGFPAELQTKMLIHAILHQFDEIERILGLPADLRVTGQSGVYHGVFEDDGVRALMSAISNASGALLAHDHFYHPGSSTLASLRETIREVQSSLDRS